MKEEYAKFRNRLNTLFVQKITTQKGNKIIRDWFAALYTASVLALALCCIGVYTFFFTLDDTSTPFEQGETPKATLNSVQLLEVVSSYQKQTEAFEKMRTVSPETPLPEEVEAPSEAVEDVEEESGTSTDQTM